MNQGNRNDLYYALLEAGHLTDYKLFLLLLLKTTCGQHVPKLPLKELVFIKVELVWAKLGKKSQLIKKHQFLTDFSDLSPKKIMSMLHAGVILS